MKSRIRCELHLRSKQCCTSCAGDFDAVSGGKESDVAFSAGAAVGDVVRKGGIIRIVAVRVRTVDR